MNLPYSFIHILASRTFVLCVRILRMPLTEKVSFQNKHSGRKLQWHHHMSNGTITLSNGIGKFDLDVTTFQMAVLFCWENRRHERLTLENLRLATELPDSELRRTLWGLVAFPKLKRQLLTYEPSVSKPTEFDSSTLFSINHRSGFFYAIHAIYVSRISGKLSFCLFGTKFSQNLKLFGCKKNQN